MLCVENVTRGTTLVDRGRVADNMWTRFVGLMGAKALPQGDGLLITPCSSIHMFWMRIPLDVVYVDKQDVVVGIDRDLKPWRVGKFYKAVRYVVELPAGTAARTATQVGDQLVVRRGK